MYRSSDLLIAVRMYNKNQRGLNYYLYHDLKRDINQASFAYEDLNQTFLAKLISKIFAFLGFIIACFYL